MAKFSKIEWTHHTFNPWWGCTKVSQACKHCYAETWARRVGQDLWGAKRDRRFFSDKHWSEPLKWNDEAEEQGERRRVFCASMADVFESRADLNPWRERLWLLIERTPWLDWLLLTKRIHRVKYHAPWGDNWPNNIWLGATVEMQKWAEKRIPELLSYPAFVRFLSCEPLLGPLDLSPWLHQGVHWVIAGGESGPSARPMHPKWAERLRDQCVEAGTPFHFKQWGHWAPSVPENGRKVKAITLADSDTGSVAQLRGLGKKMAGRALDGRTWNGVPTEKT